MKKIIIKRIMAFIIDWIIIISVGLLLFFTGPRFDKQNLLYPSIKMFSAYGVILGVIWIIIVPLIRDCLFKSVSLGKRLMGLKIVNNEEVGSVSIGKLIFRNIMFYIPIIDLIAIIFCNRSLGDMITNTKVISKSK